MSLIVNGIAEVLALLVAAYKYILLIRILLSFVSPDPSNPIVRLLYQLTEPLLMRVRRLLPSSLFQWGIDVSPLIVFILLILIENIVIKGLFQLSTTLSY